MSDEYNGIVICIPTRNRSDLAQNAINSILNQSCSNVHILVSDNSTNSDDKQILSEFCHNKSSNNLTYIQPAESFSMPQHWNWIIEYALSNYEVNHFVYLTDRTIMKKDSLQQVINIVKTYNNDIISYPYDIIADDKKPIYVKMRRWTGKLIKIHSDKLIKQASEMHFDISLPVMTNSVVPRTILEKVYKRFGNIFTSITTDLCLALRFLDMIESILFFDKSINISYALHKSNARGFGKGAMTEENKDFLETLKNTKLNYLTPIPEILCINNGLAHEYNFVRKETKSPQFPKLNKNKYFDAIAGEILSFDEGIYKNSMIKILENHGWTRTKQVKKNLMKRITKCINTFIKKIFKRAKYFNTIDEAISYVNCHFRARSTFLRKSIKRLMKSNKDIMDLPK